MASKLNEPLSSNSTTMQFVRLGDSGVKISRIIVGCMSFGKKSEYGDWVLEDEDKVMELLKECYDSGLRTFDTADVYSNGASEILLGKFLRKYKIPRYSVVILSKCFFPTYSDIPGFAAEATASKDPNNPKFVNAQGLSRKHILDSVEGSTKRLGTFIDVLQIHRFDPETPIEETVKALNDVVESGKVGYIGASSMRATQFARLQFTAQLNGWHKFISMQNYYNLIYREEEREMIPFCQETGVGLIHWSPIARGVLTRPVSEMNQSARMKSDMAMGNVLGIYRPETDAVIINRVEELAKKKGFSMAQISTAWVLSKGGCPIIGLSSVKRVQEAVESLEIELTEEEIQYLEESYLAKPAKVY